MRLDIDLSSKWLRSVVSLRLPFEETPRRRSGFFLPRTCCRYDCNNCTNVVHFFVAVAHAADSEQRIPPLALDLAPASCWLPATAARLMEEQPERRTLWPWSCGLFKSSGAAWAAHGEAVITTETGELSAGWMGQLTDSWCSGAGEPGHRAAVHCTAVKCSQLNWTKLHCTALH